MKNIPGYETRYAITRDGKVWSKITKSFRKPAFQKEGNGGYLYVGLRKYGNRKTKNFLVHRLVASAYIPNPLRKPQVNHKNGIKSDNREENLEWCFQTDNMQHAVRSGLCKLGERRKHTKLNSKIVLDIRARIAIGNVTQRELAKEYGVCFQSINQVALGKTWKHVNEPTLIAGFHASLDVPPPPHPNEY